MLKTELIIAIVGSIFLPICFGVSNFIFRLYKDSSDRNRQHDRELFKQLNNILPEKDVKGIFTHELVNGFIHNGSLEKIFDYIDVVDSLVGEYRDKKVRILHKKFLVSLSDIILIIGEHDKEQKIHMLRENFYIDDDEGNPIYDADNPQKNLVGKLAYIDYIQYIDSVKRKIL